MKRVVVLTAQLASPLRFPSLDLKDASGHLSNQPKLSRRRSLPPSFRLAEVFQFF